MSKVKEFVKKHKDVVPYVIGAGIGGILLLALGAKAKSNSKPDTEVKSKSGRYPWGMDHDPYSQECGGCNYDGYWGRIEEVPVSDLGKVGDTLKLCDGIDENSKISLLFTKDE